MNSDMQTTQSYQLVPHTPLDYDNDVLDQLTYAYLFIETYLQIAGLL